MVIKRTKLFLHVLVFLHEIVNSSQAWLALAVVGWSCVYLLFHGWQWRVICSWPGKDGFVVHECTAHFQYIFFFQHGWVSMCTGRVPDMDQVLWSQEGTLPLTWDPSRNVQFSGDSLNSNLKRKTSAALPTGKCTYMHCSGMLGISRDGR